nr:DUF5625 family protein [Dyella sp. ASV24]
MKRRLSKTFTLAALAIGLALQAACSSSSGLPEVLASAPLTMDKAGATTSVDFTVTEAHIAKYRRLMVALNFPKTNDRKLEDAIRNKKVSMEVEVVQIHDGQSIPIATQDYDANRDGSRHIGNAIANLNLYGADADSSLVLIAGFYPPKPGSYRATVKTIEDQPLFEGVDSIIKVEQYYNTGE